MDWWLSWPAAARDHDTSCISCHTALPYALARPSLRNALAERDVVAPERRMLGNVVTRVRMWRDVEPFYPDQTRGLPKTSESRGTEAVLNALILSSRDAEAGALSDDGRQAFDNLWGLQFRAGDQKGAWAWLNFHYEPWEANGSPYFGAALAALAVGRAPGGYASGPEVQGQVKLLRDYLQRGADTVNLFNRLMGLWTSSKLPFLAPAQRQAIVDAAINTQQADGGWSTASLGAWKRVDNSALDDKTDGLATGLAVLALQAAGLTRADPHVRDGLAWLVTHQDAASGMWPASSLNKARDASTDIGKFMTDAATAYAVLALTQAR
jgi:squalene-hopene/tetraprenyl-beta-curcumene cyclase